MSQAVPRASSSDPSRVALLAILFVIWGALLLGQFSFIGVEALIPGGTYAFGNQVTLADICLVPQVYNARRFKVDVSKYPKIAAAEAACMKLAAVESAKPENQPDAEQLLFHLATERRTDPRVGTNVVQRLMEAFRDHGQPSSSVDYLSGPLLYK